MQLIFARALIRVKVDGSFKTEYIPTQMEKKHLIFIQGLHSHVHILRLNLQFSIQNRCACKQTQPPLRHALPSAVSMAAEPAYTPQPSPASPLTATVYCREEREWPSCESTCSLQRESDGYRRRLGAGGSPALVCLSSITAQTTACIYLRCGEGRSGWRYRRHKRGKEWAKERWAATCTTPPIRNGKKIPSIGDFEKIYYT